jgi:hypothetical protein
VSIDEALKSLKPIVLEIGKDQILLLRVPAEECRAVAESADLIFKNDFRVVVMPDTYKIDVVKAKEEK